MFGGDGIVQVRFADDIMPDKTREYIQRLITEKFRSIYNTTHFVTLDQLDPSDFNGTAESGYSQTTEINSQLKGRYAPATWGACIDYWDHQRNMRNVSGPWNLMADCDVNVFTDILWNRDVEGLKRGYERIEDPETGSWFKQLDPKQNKKLSTKDIEKILGRELMTVLKKKGVLKKQGEWDIKRFKRGQEILAGRADEIIKILSDRGYEIVGDFKFDPYYDVEGDGIDPKDRGDMLLRLEFEKTRSMPKEKMMSHPDSLYGIEGDVYVIYFVVPDWMSGAHGSLMEFIFEWKVDTWRENKKADLNTSLTRGALLACADVGEKLLGLLRLGS